MEWTPFYSTMATAAATVIGLLFVAVQLSAERIAGDQSDRWWAIAFSTFYMFLTVFFLPLSYLSPALKPHGRAVLTLILRGNLCLSYGADVVLDLARHVSEKRRSAMGDLLESSGAGVCLHPPGIRCFKDSSDQAIRSNG